MQCSFNFSEAKRSAQALQALGSKLDTNAEQLDRAVSGMRTLQSASLQAIRNQIRAYVAKAMALSADTGRLSAGIEAAAALYAESDASSLESYSIPAASGESGAIQSIRELITDGYQIKVSDSGELIAGSASGEYGDASYTMLAWALNAGMNASWFTMDENGNYRLDPRLHAYFGASVTLLEAHMNGRIGSDWLNAHGSVDAVIGHAEMNGAAKAWLFDEEGNFNPALKAELSAEVTLASLEVEAGVTVLGVEANVNASFDVGFGAHAEAGYEDGVLSLEIGVIFGVGGSIGIEVDFGGLVDTVSGWGESFLKKFKLW